ncbi:hypothetical protein GQ457_09G019260 [Hibiscus cannabinus]
MIPCVRMMVVYRSWIFGFDSGIPRVTISGWSCDWTGLFACEGLVLLEKGVVGGVVQDNLEKTTKDTPIPAYTWTFEPAVRACGRISLVAEMLQHTGVQNIQSAEKTKQPRYFAAHMALMQELKEREEKVKRGCTLRMTRNNPQGPILPLVSEIDRLFHQRRREYRANTTMHQGDEPVDGQQHQPDGGNAGALARPRAIRDHLTPILDDLNPGIVAPEIQAAHFELKPVMFNMLNSIGKFGGSLHEDARQHIRAFLEVCDSFRQQGVHEDVLKLKLFPYSLRDRARGWLSGVPAGSLESWVDLCRSFMMRYNPPNMHTQLRNDIASFRQGDDESMMMLDALANGTLLDKSPEEAFEILDRIANNDYQFPTARLGSRRRTSGKLELDANDSVSAQLSAITNLLKNLQKPSDVREAKALSCNHCEGNHHANDCPVMHEQASYLGNYNRNSNNPYSNTYNPGWRQHPNFSWNNQGGTNASSSNRQQNTNALQGFQDNCWDRRHTSMRKGIIKFSIPPKIHAQRSNPGGRDKRLTCFRLTGETKKLNLYESFDVLESLVSTNFSSRPLRSSPDQT